MWHKQRNRFVKEEGKQNISFRRNRITIKEEKGSNKDEKDTQNNY
jgi:hypothetical protein